MTFCQSAGALSLTSAIIAPCYSGRGDFKNKPECQNMHSLGPLPQGRYTIGPLHIVPHLGPCCSLTPYPENIMFGRSGFFMHLDNPAHPGASSDGCIVLPGMTDLQVVELERGNGDSILEVVA